VTCIDGLYFGMNCCKGRGQPPQKIYIARKPDKALNAMWCSTCVKMNGDTDGSAR
jgi:hypothetical protein